MKKENNPLPDLLKYFRKKKHLTQEQVAKQLSVSRASYASYETGRIIPGMQHIIELSRILEHDFLFCLYSGCPECSGRCNAGSSL